MTKISKCTKKSPLLTGRVNGNPTFENIVRSGSKKDIQINVGSITEMMIDNCEEKLYARFGEEWVDFKNKNSSKKYNKDLVPGIFYELSTLYKKYSVSLLAELMNISRYKIEEWARKPEVEVEIEKGMAMYEHKMEAIQPFILYNHDKLEPQTIRVLGSISKLHTEKNKNKKTDEKELELGEHKKKINIIDLAIKSHIEKQK